MKKIVYTLLTLTALFVNSHVFAVEARISNTSVYPLSQALQNVKNKDNYATLKSARYDVKEKVYNITYLAKDGSVKSIKISQLNGKEVK
mgnify:CR=1 FL=1